MHKLVAHVLKQRFAARVVARYKSAKLRLGPPVAETPELVVTRHEILRDDRTARLLKYSTSK